LYLRGLKQSKSFFKKHGYFENPSNQQIENFKKTKRKMMISKIIGKFKMQISKEINQLNNTAGKTNWQLDFDDRIIRDREGYYSIKKYIIENPAKYNK
jgi:hypothetical protein